MPQLRTRIARSGHRTSVPGAPAAHALVSSSARSFTQVSDLEASYAGQGPPVYARYGSENVHTLEVALADLEGAEASLVTSTGQAATLLGILALTPAGGTVAAPLDVYGGTTALIGQHLPRMGFSTRTWSGELADLGALAGATLVVETISNPVMAAIDLGALAEECRSRRIRLLVDNTFATPLLCNPLSLGADLVMHSLTKYINGHGDLLAGALCGGSALIETARSLANDLGTTLGAFEAWLCLRGLRTLHLRFPAQVQNAVEIAGWLRGRPEVIGVNHPGQLPPGLRGPGAMLSFTLSAGGAGVERMVEAMPGIPLVPTFGDLSSTISIPALTSHRGLEPGLQAEIGVSAGMVRLSVGTESLEDLFSELGLGLVAAGL